MRAPRWHFLLGAVAAALLLALSLRGVDFASLAAALSTANYWLLIPASILTLLAFYIRAVRWGVLLRSVKVISNGSLFSATMIGFAANNLLPARLGELVRAWAIWRQEHISRSAAFATVVVERMVDVFSLLFFFGLSLLLHPFPREARQGGYVALGLNLILLVMLVLADRNPQAVAGLGKWLSRHSPRRIRGRVQSLFENFVTGLGVLRQGGAILQVALYSLLLYAVTLFGIQACLMAFPFATPWYTALVLLVTTTLGFIIAPTPGYVGSIQVACVWSLALFGVPRSEAFSFSLFYHVTQFVPITVVGLWFLARQGLSLNQAAGAAGKEVNESVQC